MGIIAEDEAPSRGFRQRGVRHRFEGGSAVSVKMRYLTAVSAVRRDAMPDEPAAPADVTEALAALGEPRPMRRGSVSLRRVKCHKPGCACAVDPERRHGPYVSLTRAVGGRTRSRLLSAGQADLARAQVAAGRRFRERVEAYWGACERWADTELGTEGVERGGSRRPSRRGSRRSSSRS
jgi:hypothetical protein